MGRIKSLQELGYGFNDGGELRRIGSDGQLSEKPFQFNISSDHQACQANYELLGAAVTEYIYDVLEREQKLYRLPAPKDSGENGTFVFVSTDYEKRDTLMVLIQGSGAVRAGQWARSLIINNNLDMGTQIPYIEMGANRKFGILIMNPNDNHRSNIKIPHSSTSEEHAEYVWKHYVTETSAKNIVIIAHSYGGFLTVMLAQKFKKDFEERVRAVAMTDSVHSFSGVKIPETLKRISTNWVSNSAQVDTPLKTPEFEITRLSAGHPQHEMTSYSCISSVFKFVDERLKC
ncbi:unnamed protein product [Leptosia nina]|uniref:Arb2 domain-containing protein n=1 Tax=Leptosia nina TaxID=320188 RepID=A0AAV1J031_9NEOP